MQDVLQCVNAQYFILFHFRKYRGIINGTEGTWITQTARASDVTSGCTESI